MRRFALGLVIALALPASHAFAFDIAFDWSGLKPCSSGNPNTVSNPRFALKDLPAGTTFIRFRLADRDAPGFNHGGGDVSVQPGQKTVEPGAFKYQSPCPPGGKHTYEWTATALASKSGTKLGTAKARRKYPD